MTDPCTETAVLIQAGGRGLRMRPYTDALPKPMLSVQGATILEHILRSVGRYDFSDCFISVCYLGHLIQAALGEFHDGLRLQYVVEDRPLGTIGAAARLPDQIGDVVVINGDLLFDCDLADLVTAHKAREADLTIATRRFDVSIPFGVVKSGQDGELLSLAEKPELEFQVCYGLNVLSRAARSLIPAGVRFDMPRLIHMARELGLAVYCHPLTGNCTDVGTVSDFHEMIQEPAVD